MTSKNVETTKTFGKPKFSNDNIKKNQDQLRIDL